MCGCVSVYEGVLVGQSVSVHCVQSVVTDRVFLSGCPYICLCARLKILSFEKRGLRMKMSILIFAIFDLMIS